MAALITVESVLLVLLAVLVCGVLRTHAEIIRSVEAYGQALAGVPPPVSTELAPTAGTVFDALGIAGETLNGEHVEYPLWSVDDRDTLLAFLTTGCLSCQTFWDAFNSDELDLPTDLRVIVVTKDRSHESRSRLRKLAPARHDLVMSNSAWSTYEVPNSPYFVYITGENAKVAGQGTADNWSRVADLLRLTRDENALAATEGLGAYALGRARVATQAPSQTNGEPR